MSALPFEIPSDLIPIAVAVAIVGISILFFAFKKSDPVVSELKIYPIKSCAPVTVKEALALDTGFENDRMAQVSDAKGSFCTPRDKQYVNLFHVKAEIHENTLELSAPGVEGNVTIDLNKETKPVDAVPIMGPKKVKLRDYGDEAAKFFQDATGAKGVRLTGIGKDYTRHVEVNPDQNESLPTDKAPVSLADEAPYLLTSTSSLKDLNARLKANGKKPVDMQRFRPNIVISGLKPWEEDSLSVIRIGSVMFHVWQRCGRCQMTTIDRDSLDRGPEPLTTMNDFRERKGQRNFGMHMIPIASSCGDTIKIGDKVDIIEYDDDRRIEWEKLFG